jgi:hypothetical protein
MCAVGSKKTRFVVDPQGVVVDLWNGFRQPHSAQTGGQTQSRPDRPKVTWLRSLLRWLRSRQITGVVHGDLVVDRDGELTGIVQGDITVLPVGSLTLLGLCQGALTVERGARASLAGVNRGGWLTISGVVCGALRSLAGETHIGCGARLGGGVQGTVILRCPRCAQSLRVPGDHSTLQVTCPACHDSWEWMADGSNQPGTSWVNLSPEVWDQFGKMFDSLFGKVQSASRPKRAWWKLW